MAQLPFADDLGVFEIEEKVFKERVLCRDLAKYLGCGTRIISRYAKDREWCHILWIDRGRSKKVSYVTPWAAARIIVYVRAMQQWSLELKEKKRRKNPAP